MIIINNNDLNILNGVEMPETMTFEDLEVCVDIDQDALVTGESNDDALVQEAKRMRFMMMSPPPTMMTVFQVTLSFSKQSRNSLSLGTLK